MYKIFSAGSPIYKSLGNNVYFTVYDVSVPYSLVSQPPNAVIMLHKERKSVTNVSQYQDKYGTHYVYIYKYANL